jgi:outer membrane biogenesis lipoprotein LolB
MKRMLPALLLATVALLTASCSSSQSGSSNPDNQQTRQPGATASP